VWASAWDRPEARRLLDMFTLRLAAVLAVTATSGVTARRLLLGEDGFARVDGDPTWQQPADVTVSSWVNLTQYPGGVAPIVSIIAADASYQVAFFLRHDGAGVLWGGPGQAGSSVSISSEIETRASVPTSPRVQAPGRHPRSRFHPQRRRKREAIDYSGGLGDVFNVMGPRVERSNSWTPMNFVDVSEMGVADLDTSGSSNQGTYDSWMDVGYELEMQESPEPKIYTRPSEANDFVAINWDGSNLPPLSSNQWDPVGDRKPFVNQPTKVQVSSLDKFKWYDESLDTESIRRPAVVSQPKPYINRKKNNKVKPRPSRPFVPDLTRTTGNTRTTRPFVDKFRYNTRVQTTSTTTTTTTTPRPVVASTDTPRKTENRVPLWARLNKPAKETQPQRLKEVVKPAPPKVDPFKSVKSKEPELPVLQFVETTRRLATTTSRPMSETSKKPSTRSTTQKPLVSKIKLAKHKHIAPLHSKIILNKKSRKPINKPPQSHAMDEFKRVFEGKPTMKDTGKKVVVYSMPITDEDAFYKMYEHYQAMESKQSPRINLHAVYEHAREGTIVPTVKEDEENQNTLEQSSDPLPILTYKEEPFHLTDSKTHIPKAPLSDESLKPSLLDRLQPAASIAIESKYRPNVNTQPTLADYDEVISIIDNFGDIPLAYEPAIIADQHINGHQPSFYQEPAKVSHQQLPPEYSKETKSSAAAQKFTEPTKVSAEKMIIVADSSGYYPSSSDTKKEEKIASQLNSHSSNPPTNRVQLPIRKKPSVHQETTTVRQTAPVPQQAEPTEIETEVPLDVKFRKMPYSFDLNTWYHITFTWSSSTKVLRVYINGQLAGLLDDSITDRPTLPTDGMVLLGKTLLPSLTGFDPTSHLTGSLSNYVVWGAALSDAEINDAFTCGKPNSHPVLLAWNTTPLRVYNDASVTQAPPICGIN